MDRVYHRFREKPAPNARLVRDDNDRQPGIVQAANGCGSEGKHTKLGGIIQVADFFGDRAVAVEKNGRA
jgi:hypothetical protein